MTLALAVSALCGVLIPAVVDLVTQSHASHALKATVAVALSALAGALATVTWTPGERWTTYALAIAAAFVTAMSSHATGYSAPVQRRTRRVGITDRPRAL